MRLPFLLLLSLLPSLVLSLNVSPGHVYLVNITGEALTEDWAGLYGRVILSTASVRSVSLSPNDVVEIHLTAPTPPCTPSSLSAYVVAVNGTLAPPLRAGDLAILSAIVDYAEETFRERLSFSTPFGTFSNVPSTYLYANGSPSTHFVEGYFNDASGNVVFLSRVAFNSLDWLGNRSDYEMLLPAGVNFTLYVVLNYTCPPPGGGGGGHWIELYAPAVEEFYVGEPATLYVVVRNRGDYIERDIAVSPHCPFPLSCSPAVIDSLKPGRSVTVGLSVFSPKAGEFPARVVAENVNARDRASVLLIFKERPKEEVEEEGEVLQPPEEGGGAVVGLPILPSLHVEVNGSLVEGEVVGVTVKDNEGQPVEKALVVGATEAFTDGKGYAEVVMPYSGVIMVIKEGYPAKRVELDVVRKATIKAPSLILPGKPFSVKVMDSKGKPVEAVIVVDGQRYATDEQGVALLTLSRSARLVAFAEGYRITPTYVEVRPLPKPTYREEVCLILPLLLAIAFLLLYPPLRKVVGRLMEGKA